MGEEGPPKPWEGVTRDQAITGGLLGVLLAATTAIIALSEEGAGRWLVVALFGAYIIGYLVILFLYLTHRIKRKD